MGNLRGSLALRLRLLIVLGAVVVMPMLALPTIGTLLDRVLYSPPAKPERPERRSTVETRQVTARPLSLQSTARSETSPRNAATGGKTRDLAGQEQELRRIQRRLDQLGASSMILERVGTDGQLFHFRCVMPLPGTSVYGRPFDATDTAAVRAMLRVQTEIERWLPQGTGAAY